MTRTTWIALSLTLVACGSRTHDMPSDAGEEPTRRGRAVDAGRLAPGDAGPPRRVDPPRDLDAGAGATDAGVAPTYREIQPSLAAACGECHSEEAPFGSAFAVRFDVLAQPTNGYNGGCQIWDGPPLTLGECVVETARNQGQRRSREPLCSGSHPGQYHRDSTWTCLDPEEVAALVAWADGGYLR